MTRRFVASVPALLLALSLLCPGRALADVKDNDAQFWFTTKLLAKLSDRVRLVTEMELRMGNGMSEMTRYHADLGVRLLLLEQQKLILTADLAYRQAFWHGYFFEVPTSISEVSEVWVAEYRPHASFTVTVPLGKFILADTVRLEGRFWDEGLDAQLRLHDVLVGAVDISAKSGYTFRLFAALAICADLHPDPDYHRTRLYAGMMFPLAGPLAINVYYMWQRFRVEPGWWSWHMGWEVGESSWWNWHILGLSLSISIGMDQDPAGGSSS